MCCLSVHLCTLLPLCPDLLLVSWLLLGVAIRLTRSLRLLSLFVFTLSIWEFWRGVLFSYGLPVLELFVIYEMCLRGLCSVVSCVFDISIPMSAFIHQSLVLYLVCRVSSQAFSNLRSYIVPFDYGLREYLSCYYLAFVTFMPNAFACCSFVLNIIFSRGFLFQTLWGHFCVFG